MKKLAVLMLLGFSAVRSGEARPLALEDYYRVCS